MKIQNVQFVKSAPTAEAADIDHRPQIALAGRSNVGKSSLLNALAHQRQLARVSNTPGRTQTINLFLVNDLFYFADLPGYGFAKVPQSVQEEWGRHLEEYLRTAPRLAGVVTIFDVRRDLRKDDEDLLAWLASLGRPVIAVVTKIDKLKKHELSRRISYWKKTVGPMSSGPPIPFSAESRAGKPELLNRLTDLVEGKLSPAPHENFPGYAFESGR